MKIRWWPDLQISIQVTHIECGAVNRAVEGCLQYHTSVSGTIRFGLGHFGASNHNDIINPTLPLSLCLFVCVFLSICLIFISWSKCCQLLQGIFIANTGASTLWMPRDFTSPTRSIRCQHSFPTTHWNHRLTSKTWCRCVFAASVASVGSATQPARTWSTKLSDSQMQRFWKDADQVHNQSESFTVSEAGLAGGGQPVVKVTQADSLTCDQK